MKREKFLEEQIIYALPQTECGASTGHLCRQLGGSAPCHLGLLEGRNSRLKRLVADRSLD